MKDLETAHEIAKVLNNQHHWQQLADLASQEGQLVLAQNCLHNAKDFSGLLLLATSTGNVNMVEKLANSSNAAGKNNISFLSNFLLGDLDKCLDILVETDRLPEAAFFARTYAPSKISAIVALWREKLSSKNEKAGQSIADPEKYENLFPGYKESLDVEKFMREQYKKRIPASEFPKQTVR